MNSNEIISIEKRMRAFVIKSKGRWSKNDVFKFQELLKSREIGISHSEIEAHLEVALDSIKKDGSKFYVCNAGPCSRHERSSQIKQYFSKKISEETICQWGCDEAPLVTSYTNGQFVRMEGYQLGQEDQE